jgi:sRNA-binding protein
MSLEKLKKEVIEEAIKVFPQVIKWLQENKPEYVPIYQNYRLHLTDHPNVAVEYARRILSLYYQIKTTKP